MPVPRATDELIYLLAWALAPLLMFTLAGNILWTYVLPGLAPAALVLAEWSARLPHARRTDIALAAVLAGWMLAVALALPVIHRNGSFERRSTAWLVDLQQQQSRGVDAPLLYVGAEMPFSLSFYSNRRARRVDSVQALAPELKCPSSVVALPPQDVPTLLPGPGQRVTPLRASAGLALLRVDCADSP
jgi:hypothetical protein